MSSNAALCITAVAEKTPNQKALIYREQGQDHYLTYREFELRASQYAFGLRTFGIRPGDKVLLMESNGPRFLLLFQALFKLGAIPVLIDPGMGLKNVLNCISNIRPDILIGVTKSQILRSIYRDAFSNVRRSICTDGRWLGASPLWRVCPSTGTSMFSAVTCQSEQPAALLFTSGSTGAPKAVVYRHGIFHAQVAALHSMFDFTPGGVDMAGFPAFAFLSLAVGQTCFIPAINPSRPATVRPEEVLGPIRDYRISQLTGSPAIWEKVGQYCQHHGIKLPTVKRVLTFGAAISLELIKTWHEILGPEGDIFTPYGATEALPVACIGGRYLLAECSAHSRGGGGSCVGKPVAGVEVRIIKTSDDTIGEWREDIALGPGEIGEVVVSGPCVTWAYFDNQEATKASKIIHGDRIWHRMGDLGYLDHKGQLWIVGRKSHRVQGRSQVYYPVSAENILDGHPDVKRTALVGVGPAQNQTPVIVIEPRHLSLLTKPAEKQRVIRELKELLKDHAEYGDISQFMFHPRFPVDRRHNAKIHREELAVWAETQVLIPKTPAEEAAENGVQGPRADSDGEVDGEGLASAPGSLVENSSDKTSDIEDSCLEDPQS